MRKSNLHVNVNKMKHADKILEMKTFHNLKYKACPHERLNTSKGVIRNIELSLVTPEEINAALEMQ